MWEELHLSEKYLQGYTRFIVDIFVDALDKKGKKKVVDYGAGIGTLSLLYERLTQIRPYCVEIDSNLARHLSDRGLPSVPDVRCIEGPVDGIFSSNVLEHIDDDREALRSMHEILVPDGILVLYLPACSILFSSMDRKFGHFRRYDKRDLIQKVENAGFTITQLRYVDSLGFFCNLMVKVCGYDTRSGLGSPASLRIYDNIVFPLSRVLDRLGARWLFGKNILLISHKKPL